MSRRPSYQQPSDDLTSNSAAAAVPLLATPPRRRASYAHEQIRVDYHQAAEQQRTAAGIVPFAFSSRGGGVAAFGLGTGAGATAEKYRDDPLPSPATGGGGKYIQLDMDGVRSPLAQLRLPQRNRRTWERILVVVLLVVCIVLLAGGREKGGALMERTKVKVGARRKNPLKSSIPLHSFRSNLKDGKGYVTSFPYGGLTNQLIETFKLVHLGQRLDRAAILPELKAVHSEGGDLPLSTFFDLASLSYYSNVSLVEWRDVKIGDTAGTQSETLSCWGWRDESPLARYNIKTWFWPPPGQLTVPSSIETSMTFPAIEVLVSQEQTKWLEETAERYFGSMDNAPPLPDKQLLCFENLFYVPSTRFVQGTLDSSHAIEDMSPSDPVWSTVGVHLRFNAEINHIADELLHALLGPRRAREPFVSVHLRQGDFVDLGRIGRDVIDAYKEGVKVVQEGIRAKRLSDKRWRTKLGSTGGRGKDLPVVFATDSDDPSFIRKLQALGWIYIDHVEFATQARFGGWYPGVLDSVILSRSAGFVGTKMSTFSYVSQRRVEAWNDGVTTIVG